MTNNILTAIVLLALVGTVAYAPAPEPASPSVAVRTETAEAMAEARSVAAANALEIYREPVPVMRSVRPSPKAETSPEAMPLAAEAKGRGETAARAAIEADGYKGVSALSKGSNGTWRAKAYRGTTAVQLTVDAAGQVSAD